MNNMNNIDKLDNIKNDIINYFIDDNIVINDDDKIKIKIEKFLLKYKRIIAMICLIILLIIGYHCDPYSINYNYINYNKTQKGGGVEAPAAPAAPTEPAAPALSKKEKKQVKKDAKAAAKKEAPSIEEKWKAKGQTKMASHKASMKEKKEAFKKKAMSTSTYTAPFKAIGSALTSKADLIFQLFYAIALFILICIVTLPALAFIVVGIICYVLLKPKIEAIKAL